MRQSESLVKKSFCENLQQTQFLRLCFMKILNKTSSLTSRGLYPELEKLCFCFRQQFSAILKSFQIIFANLNAKKIINFLTVFQFASHSLTTTIFNL
jgi:hypothetical protein